MTSVSQSLRLLTLRSAAGRAAVLLLPVLLWSCAGDDEASRPCPRIVVVQDAARQIKFDGPGRDLTDVMFEARIDGFGVECDYDDDALEVEMRVRVEAARGPAAKSQKADISYFVAVSRGDDDVLVRESFTKTIPLEGNRTRMAAVDELTPRIPLGPNDSGAFYRIYVGLELTPEELTYNRANR